MGSFQLPPQYSHNPCITKHLLDHFFVRVQHEPIIMHSLQAAESILRREDPDRVVYAPNYWQWFSHQQKHGLLPEALASCNDQLDMLNELGVDVFSRNIYCDQRRCWFGGLSSEEDSDFECETKEFEQVNGDLHIERTYHFPSGSMTERQRHVFRESTLVQDKFLITPFSPHESPLDHLTKKSNS